MARCAHKHVTKVVDKLGLMTSHVTVIDGKRRIETSAPILEWHYECDDCHVTVPGGSDGR